MENQIQDPNTEPINEHRVHRRPLERLSYSNKGKYFKLRQILNIIFILLCVVGMVMYIWLDQTKGGIVLITAVVFKIFECLLRMVN